MRPIRADVKVMASDLTLIGLFAKDAPDEPLWFKDNYEARIWLTDRGEYMSNEIPNRFYQWRLYHAYKMIELLNKVK